MNKYKTKVTVIIHIIKAINTLKHNVKQASQVENSPTSFKDKIRCQSLENFIINLLIKLNYPSINKFLDILKDEALIES